MLVVDDFAHHPTAVRETIAAIRHRYPERRLWAIFEPRSNTSRRNIHQEEYAHAFTGAARASLKVPERHDKVPAERGAGRAQARRGPQGPGHRRGRRHGRAPRWWSAWRARRRPGDVLLVMSNGAFGGFIDKLLAALQGPAGGAVSAQRAFARGPRRWPCSLRVREARCRRSPAPPPRGAAAATAPERPAPARAAGVQGEALPGRRAVRRSPSDRGQRGAAGRVGHVVRALPGRAAPLRAARASEYGAQGLKVYALNVDEDARAIAALPAGDEGDAAHAPGRGRARWPSSALKREGDAHHLPHGPPGRGAPRARGLRRGRSCTQYQTEIEALLAEPARRAKGSTAMAARRRPPTLAPHRGGGRPPRRPRARRALPGRAHHRVQGRHRPGHRRGQGRARRCCSRFLRERYPDHAILAEESGASAGHGGLRWIVDPLDGTTNYAHRVPHFCVSVAVEGPDGRAGRRRLRSDARRALLRRAGQGATLNGAAAARQPPSPALTARCCAPASPTTCASARRGRWGCFNRFIRRAQGIRRMGSAALDLAYVAGGPLRRLLRVRPQALGHRRGRAAGAGGRRRRCTPHRRRARST